MAFKNLLLGLGGTGIIGGASVGIYYGIKGEEKNAEDSKAVVDSEKSVPTNLPGDKGEKAEDKNGKSGEEGDNSAGSSETDNQQ